VGPRRPCPHRGPSELENHQGLPAVQREARDADKLGGIPEPLAIKAMDLTSGSSSRNSTKSVSSKSASFPVEMTYESRCPDLWRGP